MIRVDAAEHDNRTCATATLAAALIGMKLGLLILAAALLAGCARFQPEPLVPARTAEQLEGRSLTNAALKTFLEQNLHSDLAGWPAITWDFDRLTLAAFYYHPSLEVARAQWSVALGGETTAAQRPNPALNVTPGYNATTLTASPWIPLGFLDMPLETAGKRGYRRAQAAQLSAAARLNISATAWQVRSNLRSSLVDLTAAEQREALLERQLSLQEQVVQRLQQQVQAGALASSEAVPFRIAWQKMRLDLADTQRVRAEARARVAEAIGVPTGALDEIVVAFDWLTAPGPAADLTSTSLRRAALRSRPDILGALAEYAASQAALQLAIARQYPDVRLQPGYQFDQGDSKWSLGLSVELPVLNQNQGPIAEAKAHRQEAAARFTALQAKVLAEIERTVAVLRNTETNSALLRSLADEQAERREAVAAQVKAGAADQVELLNAQLESASADLVQLEGQIRLQQAIGAVENAVQRPLSWPQAILESRQSHAN
jgi:outer membrane protein, heavy metal efflux system